ncbi:MAG: hypothetical protein IIA60_09375, partial [Candidatus Marinimicrobia bacterium]|nr:hypothetical protein [Candidatus Neomarinimicrobiota bacterium]
MRSWCKLALLIGLVLPRIAPAQYEIPASVIANGGGTTGAGSYIISGTVGQSAPGSVAAGSYIVGGGFWEAAQALTGGPPADIDTIVVDAAGGGDFTTFQAAVAYLTDNGVTKPVQIHVVQGTYTEQVTLGPITGVSAANTITFEPHPANSDTVHLEYAATSDPDNWVVKLDGAQYITIKGLTIKALGTTYARCIFVLFNADHNQFLDNTLYGSATTGTDINRAIIIFGANTNFKPDSVVIRGNIFNNGSHGVWVAGAPGAHITGLKVENNTFIGQNYRGVDILNADGPVITGNRITATAGSNAGFRGIHLEDCINDWQITNNIIEASTGGYGLYLLTSSGTAGGYSLVANNVISVGTTNGITGIYIGSLNYLNVYHNTANMTDGGSNALRVTSGTYINLQNNILVNTGVGAGRAIAIGSTTAIDTSDHNDLYSTGANLAQWNGVDYADLAAYQSASGQEANSISADPRFVDASANNYHLRDSSPAIGAGDPAIVMLDIENNSRPIPTGSDPDLGAYENVLGTPINDPPTITLLSPNGGEVWNEDAGHSIFWEASDDEAVTRIQLLFTSDGGVNYTVLRDSIDNDGEQGWRVPRIPTTNARIKIVAYNALGQTAVDSSDGFFTIQDVETYIHATGALSHTVRNDGRTGSGSGAFDAGEPSLEYPVFSGNDHLYIGQLLLMTVNAATDTIAALPYGDNYHPETAITILDQGTYIETKTRFTDKLGLGLEITERTFAANNESYVIQAYTIHNNSAATYSQLHAAFFVDFDLNDPLNNLSAFYLDNHMAYMADRTGVWESRAGIRLLDQPPTAFRRWGGALGELETPGQLFLALATPGYDDPGAGPDPAGDYRLALALGPLNLAPGDSVTVAFSLAAGADITGLLTATQNAQDFWTSLNAVPLANSGSGLFNAESQRIRVLNGNPVDPNVSNEAGYQISGNQITIEAWVYPVRPLAEGQVFNLAGYANSANHPYMLSMIGEPAGNLYRFQISDGTNWWYAQAPNVVYNSWTHLAGTYDGANNELRLYVNGVVMANFSPTTPVTNLDVNGTGFYIGRFVESLAFGGLIDEVRLWDVARNFSDINNLMFETLTGAEPDLAGYWPINEFSPNYPNAVDPLTGEVGRVVEDKTGNGNHLWAQYGAAIHSGIFQDGVNAFEPFLVSRGDFEAVVGEYFSFNPLAGGGPGTVVSLVATPPTGMAYDAGTNVLSWTPAAGQFGYQTFTLQAANGSGSVQQDYIIWVGEYAINFADHNNNNTLFSVFNDGSVGADFYGLGGSGFGIAGDYALFEGSLIVAAAGGLISTSLYGDHDFATRSDVVAITSDLPGFDQAYQSEFDDDRSAVPIGVRLVQRSHSKASAPDDDYVILTYDIENISGGALTGVYVALFMDWDVGDWSINLGGYDDSRDLIYTFEDQSAQVPPAEKSPSPLEPDELDVRKHNSKMAGNLSTTAAQNLKYYGTVVLQGQVTGRSVGAIGSSDAALLGHLNVLAGTPTVPTDMRSIHVVGAGDIPNGGTVQVAFAVLGGNDLADLQANADAAQAAFDATPPLANSGSGLFNAESQRIRVLNGSPVDPNVSNAAAYQISGNQI